MITQDKITDIFCTVDEFSKKFDMEIAKGELISSNGIRRRHRNASLSDGEIMTILIVFHFGTFANFKHYYLHYIRVHLHQDFPDAVSYNRFVELETSSTTICIISGYICVGTFRTRYPITGSWNLKAAYSSS